QSAYREAVLYYEQALQALAHLPESPDTLAQAVDLRLDLRNVFFVLGELGRIHDTLLEAEPLAEALGDPRRPGRNPLHMAIHFSFMPEYDHAITTSQHALTLASGDVGTQVVAYFYLGMASSAQGDYQRAMDVLRQSIASLTGDLLYERLGHALLPSVLSRATLALCLAEVGSFAEAVTVGEDGLRIAEA